MEGRGAVRKTAVLGMKDRPTKQVQAQVVDDTKAETLRAYLLDRVDPETVLYTDDSPAYDALENRESVRHSAMEYVRGECHTNVIESFWSMLKRAHMGTFHRLTAKHLDRYVAEFVGRHNFREKNTIDQMREVVARMIGHRLMYKDLVG